MAVVLSPNSKFFFLAAPNFSCDRALWDNIVASAQMPIILSTFGLANY